MIKKITLSLLAIASGISGLLAQSNPTPQNLPYTQSFGTAAFSSMPAGMAAWLAGGNKTTKATAESSTPAGDASVGTATASTATGGVFGYAASGDARAYIQLSGNTTNGTSQLGLAFNTGTATAVNISYQVELLNSGSSTQDLGLELMYHVGSTATTAWTAVPGASLVISGTSFTTQTYTYSLTGLTASTNYQLRWVTWRAGSGSGKGVGIDNISVSAPVVAIPSFNVSNNGLQPTASSVLQGSNKNMLQRFILRETNVAAGTLNSISIPLAGTYSASDINAAGLKLYTAPTNNYASATVLSSQASASAGSGETVTFSSLNYAVAQNSTQYFWVTSDIDAAATVGNTIRATALSVANFTFAAGTVTASVNQGGIQTIAAPTPSLNITNNGAQPTATTVLQSTSNHLLQSFVVTEANVAAATLNIVSIPLAGTYLSSDINGAGLKLYGSTTNNFATAMVLSSNASASSGSGETVAFSGLNYAIARNSAHYFWVTADIAAAALVGNTINASALTTGNFNFAAGSVAASVNAGGVQTIDAPLATTQLRTSYCGYTAQSFGEFIGADSVLTANHYRFQLVNAANSYTQTFTNSSGYPYLALYLIPGISYNTTYTVSVAWSADGTTWSSYGAPCALTSPATETTVVEPADCGLVYTGWNNLISAVQVSGATNYRFQLENAALSYTQTFTNVNKNFNFNSYTGLVSSTPYTVSVAVELLGVWNPYGPGCTVTTPAAPTTSMLPQYCGYTPSSYTELMTAESQVGSSFRFKLENVALGYSQTFTNVNRNVNLAQYPGIVSGTTYSISVSVFFNGAYGPYGPECTITVPAAPTSSMLPQYCGYTPSSYTELMTAEAQAGSGYRFKLENTALGYSQTFSNVNRNVNLVQYTGLTAGATYSISVSVLNNGVYGAYGNVCQVTVPSAAPTTSVVPANCGYTPATYSELMNVHVVQGATSYEYKLENAALGYSQTFTNVHQNFNFRVYTGLNTSTTYTVSARAYFNGAWGPYGPACTVTTPSSSALMATLGGTAAYGGAIKRTIVLPNQTSPLDALAYPNPFNDRFAINLLSYTVNEPVSVRVFDATGKLMEEHSVQPESLKDLLIGASYAQGLYNIVISQGAQSKSIKVIRS